VFARYLHLLRVAFLTRCEVDTPGHAGRTIFAFVCAHLAVPVLLVIAATGGIRGLSRGAILVSFIIPMLIVIWWESMYVERSDQLETIWQILSAQSPQDQNERRRSVSWLMWGSYAALILAFGAICLRAALKGAGLAPH